MTAAHALPPLPPIPMRRWERYNACMRGTVPAESLALRDADLLIKALHGMGWTLDEIAGHTRWSTYTVGRKLDRLGLQLNTEAA